MQFISKAFNIILKISMVFLILLISTNNGFAQLQKGKKFKSRLSIAPLKSTFKNDPNLTSNTKNKFGFASSYELEYQFLKKSSLLIGIQHIFQHVSFNGYFTGNTFLYDETFPYLHDLRIQELHFPINVKYSFLDERSYDITPYIKAGGGIRTIIKTYGVIVNDSIGLTLFDSKTKSAEYEYKTPSSTTNSFLTSSVGIQKNYRKKHRAIFFELTYRYGIARYRYLGTKNSNNLLISNQSFALVFGCKI